MLSNEWKEVQALVNEGEDDDRVFARARSNYVEIAYYACGCVTVTELCRVKDIIDMSSDEMSKVISEADSEYEIALKAKDSNGEEVICLIDGLSSITGIDGETIIGVTSREEYDADSIDEVDEELLEKFDLI